MRKRRKFSWPHPVEAEAHITSELSRGGFDWIDGRKNIKINCPFPHDGKPDSGHNLEILKNGRKAHCWVCDWKGSWNKLARETGLSEFNADEDLSETYTKKAASSDVFASLLQEINSLVDDVDPGLPEPLTRWSQPVWRGLHRKFMRRFPAYLWNQEVSLTNDQGRVYKTFQVDRILWPYYQYDRLVGYVGRRLDRGDKIKYYRAPWCEAKKCFFPFDYVREYFPNTKVVVLVEGEVDALRLLQAKVPTLSILGSNNWSEVKRDLLVGLGVRKVFLLMDPDAAGRKAEKTIKESLKGYIANVEILRLDDGDPGDMDGDQLEWLRQTVHPTKN